MAIIKKILATVLEASIALLALWSVEQVLQKFDWTFKDSIEAAVLALGGWWAFIRSVVRPPVFFELRPVESLQKSNPVRGLEPVVANASRMSRRVNVRITGLPVERGIDNLPLGPGQQFPLSGIARPADFRSDEKAEVTVSWTGWRNCKWLGWLTTRSVTWIPKDFGSYVSPLSVHQSGPSEQLKDIAGSLEQIAKNRISLADQQGVQEGVTIRLSVPANSVLMDKLVRSNGFCRVVQTTNRNAMLDKTGHGMAWKEFEPTGESHEDLWLQFLSDDDLERMCREQHNRTAHEQKGSEDATEIDRNRVGDDPGDRHE